MVLIKEKRSFLVLLLNFFKRILTQKNTTPVGYYKIARKHKPYPKLKIVP